MEKIKFVFYLAFKKEKKMFVEMFYFLSRKEENFTSL